MRHFYMKIVHFLLFFLAGRAAFAFTLHCASVSPSGSVTIAWDNTGLSGAAFTSYEVYHSTLQSGPYALITSVFIFGSTTYTDASALANNNPAYYYVIYKNTSGTDVYSDTIRAIYLSVTNPGTGFADLYWNVVKDPLIATNSTWYKVYREYPPGFFTLIDSVNASSGIRPMEYHDQISICQDTIKYRVEVSDASGCKSISNVNGDFFRDLQPPVSPPLDSVTVNAAGNIDIAWEVSPSPDTREYVILRFISGGWVPIDTVTGINSTFLSTSLAASGSVLSFQVLAVDSCGNPGGQSTPHSNIQLNASFLLCEKSIELSWTPYNFWNSNVTYEILRSVNGSGETVTGTTSLTSYRDSGLVSGSTYCYRVRAREVPGGRSSTSFTVCLSPNFPAPPAFSYLRTATVTGPSSVLVKGYVDASAAVLSYELLRSVSPVGPFRSVASQPATGNPEITFRDMPVDPASEIYYYRIATIDSCGLSVLQSQVCHTILLTAKANSNYTNTVTWSDYGDFGGGVSAYQLYRKVNGKTNPIPLAVFPPGSSFTYTDTVIDDFYSNGEFCYYAEAVEAQGNPYFYLDTSRSNEVCVKQDPVIFIPNAFRPGGGLNDYFGPLNGFIDAEDYRFTIFNRWGEEIFDTRDPNERWDGSTSQQQSPAGVYVYIIKARNADGEIIQRIGSVTLIR